MEIYAILALMATHFIALIVPGPDIFLILRTSLAHGFKQSVYACLGVGVGIVIWVFLTAFGLKTLFSAFPFLQTLLMIFSFCYLFWLSFLLFKSAMKKNETKIDAKVQKDASPRHFFCARIFNKFIKSKGHFIFCEHFFSLRWRGRKFLASRHLSAYHIA